MKVKSVKCVGSKYGSNGNYDGNDGFPTPQIENETRRNAILLY
jgi:hypothetical protein